MADNTNLINRIIENVLVNRVFEALDFKNIEPYEIRGSFFDTALGKVEISLVQIHISDVSDRLNSPERQSYNFYDFKKEPKLYNLGFALEDSDTQYTKSNYKELIKILYTVFLFAKKLLETKDIFAIFIAATPKENSKTIDIANIDTQKNTIYKHIIMNNIPNGYDVVETKYASLKPGFLIYKKTLPKK